IVGGVVAVPLLLLGANEMRAKSAFERLRERYDEVMQAKDPNALRALAQECADAPSGIFIDASRLQAMAQRATGMADAIEKKRLEDERIRQEQREREAREAAEREEKARRRKEAEAALAALDPLRAEKSYREYTDKALAFYEAYSTEFPDLTSAVRIPV